MPLTNEQRKARIIKAYPPAYVRDKVDAALAPGESRSDFTVMAIENELKRRQKEKGGATFTQHP